MTWKRRITLILPVCFVLIAVALQFEKPSVQMKELRPNRCATHFRAVEFAPGTDIAWAVGFNGAVYITRDAGLTWNKQNSNTTARLYGIQVIDEKLVRACGSSGTLIQTLDGGKTWENLSLPVSVRILDVCFVDEKNGWIVGDDGIILRTSNSGQSWIRQSTNILSGLRHIWFADTQLGYAVGYEGVVLKTRDGGDNWDRLNTPEHMSIYGADFSDNGRTFHLVGSCGTILESTDFGEKSKLIPIVTTNFLRDVTSTPDGNCIAVGYGITLQYLADQQKWQKSQTFPCMYLQGVAMNHAGKAIAVGRWGAVLTSDNAGASWTINTRVFSPDLYAVATSETGAAIAAGADGWTLVRTSHDAEWTPVFSGASHTLRSAAVDSLGRFWVVGRLGTAFRKNKNSSWTHVPIPVKEDLNDIYFTNCSQGYIVGDNGLILHSPDDGNTWKLLARPSKSDLMGVTFFNRDKGFTVGEEGIILETLNAGNSWLRHYTGTQDTLKSCHFDPNGHAVVIGTQTALESFSNGHNSSWHTIDSSNLLTAITPDGRYAGMFHGEILDRSSGIERTLASEKILDFSMIHGQNQYLGAGEFGRIVHLVSSHKSNDPK